MYGKETTQFGKKIHRTEDALILHRALQYKQKSRISHMAKKKKKPTTDAYTISLNVKYRLQMHLLCKFTSSHIYEVSMSVSAYIQGV